MLKTEDVVTHEEAKRHLADLIGIFSSPCEPIGGQLGLEDFSTAEKIWKAAMGLVRHAGIDGRAIPKFQTIVRCHRAYHSLDFSRDFEM